MNKNVKIVVPVIGENDKSVLSMMKEAVNSKADIIEWRIDYYQDIKEIDKVVTLLKEISAMIKENNKELIFTCRSESEGGNAKLTSAEYLLLNKTAILGKLADYVDVEFLKGDTIISSIANHAQAHGAKIIVSSHDFDSTPRKDVMVSRIKVMKEKGADYMKIACMPRTQEDVQEMMDAGKEVNGIGNVILISMGELGKETRLHPELLGSCMTFGCLQGQASAPGQVEVDELYKTING